MKFNFNKHSTANKIFISYFITFIIPLIVMGIVVYIWITGIIQEQTQKVYVDILNQTQDDIDKRFSELKDFSYTLATTQWVQKITFMNTPYIDYERISQIELNDYLRDLNNYKAQNSFIEELAIYIHNKDSVLYPGGIDKFDWFFSKTFNFEGVDAKEWKKVISEIKTFDLPKLIPLADIYRYDRLERMFTYIKTLPMWDQNPRATLLIFIKEDTIKNILERSRIDESSMVCILDEHKKFITGTNINEKIKTIIEEQEYTKTQNMLPDYIKDSEGKSFFAFYSISDSDVNPWTFIALLPVKVVMAEVDFLKYVTIILIVILLSVGLFSSYKFAIRDYLPLKHLIGMFGDKNKQLENRKKGVNEYKFIEDGIQSIRTQYEPVALRDYFMQLLNGQSGDVDINSINEEALSRYNKPLFTVVVFDLNEIKNKEQQKLLDLEKPIYLLNQGKNFVVIVNTLDEDQANEILTSIKEIIGDCVTIGVGGLYEKENLWRSFNEACTALDYELLKGKGAIIRFSDISIKNNKSYYYPLAYGNEFIKQIFDGSSAAAKKSLLKLVKRHLAQSHLPTAIERYLFYKQIITALETLPDESFEKIIEKHKGSFESDVGIDNIQYYVENICKELCEVVLMQKDAYESRLKKDILDCIDQNYADASMSLNLLADKFSMSAPHMSNFFREQIGENFTDYLPKLRITVAKKLLSHGELSVEETGRQVGYVSVLTFRRAFKKYENVTPGKYKETCSEIMNS